MVNYICPRCQYDAKQKSNFRRHIFRKNQCKNIFSDLSIIEICKKFNIVYSNDFRKTSKNIPQKSSFLYPKNPHFIPQKSSLFLEKKNICQYCEKYFSSYKNCWRHQKYNCKIKKQKYIIEEKNKKISNLENKIKNITNNNTISNSNINSNNIIINNFFDTKNENIFNRLNNKKIIKYLNNKSYSNLLSLLCKQIYFNDKFPEDKNIKCTNLQSKLCDVFVDDSFKKMHKKKAYEHLTDKMAFIIQDLGDENKEKINNKGKKNINLTQETLDNPEQHYDTINLELYNNSKNMNI
jgi:hypothetical protein